MIKAFRRWQEHGNMTPVWGWAYAQGALLLIAALYDLPIAWGLALLAGIGSLAQMVIGIAEFRR